MTKTWRSRDAEYFHGYARYGKRDVTRDDVRRRERGLEGSLKSRDLQRLAKIEEDTFDDDEG
jgi:hypothetical protein